MNEQDRYQQLLDKYQIRMRTIRFLNPITLEDDFNVVFENASSEPGFEQRLLEFKKAVQQTFSKGKQNE